MIQVYVVVGEALVDLVGQRGARTFVAHPGGSPANVALGLARLGDRVTLITRLGRDALGQMVRAHLEASGVVVDAGPGPGGDTSLAIATLAAGVAGYDFRIDWDVADLAPLPIETSCLHSGSLATVLAPGASAVVDLLRRERARGRATLSYDPNVRAPLLGSPERARPGIEEIVELVDVVKVSDEDLAWLYPGESDEDVAHRWISKGPALVVVTRGGKGVYAVSHQVQIHQAAVPVNLVDTVGAGDSFTSALLDGLGRAGLVGGERRAALAGADRATLEGILDQAAMVAAITCSRPGADPPSRSELDATVATRSGQRVRRTRESARRPTTSTVQSGLP